MPVWCHNNNLFLNVNKTKEIIIDFRKNVCIHKPLGLDDSPVEIVDSFRFLGIQITSSLSWSFNTTCILKKAQQRLFFLRRLKSFGVGTTSLINLQMHH